MMKKIERFVLPFTLVLLAFFLVYDGLQPIQESSDNFWHARMGGDFLKFGLTAFRDRYSFTLPGHPIQIYALLYDLLSYFSYAAFGFVGFQILRVACWGVSLFTFDRVCRKYAYQPAIEILGAAFLVFALISRNTIRPELVGVPFLILMSFIYLNCQVEYRIRTVAELCLLFIVWHLAHSSALIGYPIIGAYIINWFFALLSKRSKDFKGFLIASAIALVAGYAPWRANHAILLFFNFDPRWAIYVREINALDTHLLPTAYFIYLYLGGVALLYRLYKRDIGSCILLVSFAWQFFSSIVIVPLCLIATLPIVMDAMRAILDGVRELPQLRAPLKRLIVGLVLAGIPCVVLAEGVLFLAIAKPALGLDSRDIPVVIAKDLAAQKAQGNLLADFDLANFVLFTMGDDVKVFMDSRTNILYPIDHLKDYYLMSADPDLFKSEVDRYQVDYVLTRLSAPTAEFYFSTLKSKEFNISEVAGNQIFFSRTDKRFEHLTEIAARPEHFSEVSTEKFREEIKTAEASWTARDRESFLIDLLAKALAQPVLSKEFFTANELLIEKSDPNIRFAAYLAEKAGLPQLPFYFYSKLQNATPDDWMKMAELAFDDKQISLATSLAERVPGTTGDDLRVRKRALLSKLQ